MRKSAWSKSATKPEHAPLPVPSRNYFRDMVTPLMSDSAVTDAEWQFAWVSAYWTSPLMPIEEWREKICATDINQSLLLENAIEFMRPVDFIKSLSRERFTRIWCRIREFCPRRLFGARKAFDLYWAVLATGYFRTPPMDSWWQLSPQEKKAVTLCMRAEGSDKKTVIQELATLFPTQSGETLAKLDRLGFIFISGNRVWRNASFQESQTPRPVVRRTFRLNGTIKTYTSSPVW